MVTQSRMASLVASFSVAVPAPTPRTSAPSSRMRNTFSCCLSMSCTASRSKFALIFLTNEPLYCNIHIWITENPALMNTSSDYYTRFE